jgi:hypothetical protein
MRRNTDHRICRKEEDGSHVLQCEGTRNWRDMIRKEVHKNTPGDWNKKKGLK